VLIVVLTVFLFAFAFDYKGDVGGDLPQYLMGGAALSFGLVGCAIQFLRRSTGFRGAFPSLVAVLVYVVYAFIVSRTNSAPLDQAARMILPYVLLWMALGVGCAAVGGGLKPELIGSLVLYAAIATVAWRIVYGVAFRGVNLAEARYEILSPGLPFLIAWLAAVLVTNVPVRPLWWIVLLVTIVVVGLSITRSFLLTIAAVMVTAVYYHAKLTLLQRPVRKVSVRYGTIVVGLIVGMVVAAGVLQAIRPDVLTQWNERVFHQIASSGRDITFTTRLAEASGIVKDVFERPSWAMFGKGMGNSYRWDNYYMPEIGAAMEVDVFYEGVWYSAHSQWTYLLFGTGLVGLAAAVWWSWKWAVHCHSKLMSIDGNAADLNTVWAHLSIVALFSQSFTTAPIHERFTPCALGVLLMLSGVKSVRGVEARWRQPHRAIW
jgi:hypothetical protein